MVANCACFLFFCSFPHCLVFISPLYFFSSVSFYLLPNWVKILPVLLKVFDLVWKKKKKKVSQYFTKDFFLLTHSSWVYGNSFFYLHWVFCVYILVFFHAYTDTLAASPEWILFWNIAPSTVLSLHAFQLCCNFSFTLLPPCPPISLF